MKKGVKRSPGKEGGVTLVELLVVMAIIGIVVLVGVNMMGGVITKHRLDSAAGELSARLRGAQMIAVARNQPVTVIIVSRPNADSGDFYFACVDSDQDGSCADEAANSYINLDSGRTGTLASAKKEMHKFVELYAFQLTATATNAVTYLPPSGLVETITGPGGALANGVVCLRGEMEDSGDFDERFAFRRITVNPVVGRTIIWKNTMGIAADPACRNNPENDAGWERLY